MSEDFDGCTRMLAADVLRGATRWHNGLVTRSKVWDALMATQLQTWYATLSWFEHLMTFNTWRRRTPAQLRQWYEDLWSWDRPHELKRLTDKREDPSDAIRFPRRWVDRAKNLPPETAMFVPCDDASAIASWDNDKPDPWLKPTDPVISPASG